MAQICDICGDVLRNKPYCFDISQKRDKVVGGSFWWTSFQETQKEEESKFKDLEIEICENCVEKVANKLKELRKECLMEMELNKSKIAVPELNEIEKYTKK